MTMHQWNVNRRCAGANRRGTRRSTLVGLVATATALCAAPLGAQSSLPHLDDGSVVPRGLFRVRAITVWSRFDSRFTRDAVEPLGAPFTSNALGREQLPALASIQAAVASAAGQPFTISLGQSRLDARGRHESVPVGLEYGLTDRITLGVEVPIVRRRVAVQLRLDSTGATVGPNLHRIQTAAASTNALLQSQFDSAARQLQSRLAGCRANPAAAGCTALLQREAEAQQLVAASQSFAVTVGSLYGTSSSDGMAFVPRSGSPAQTDIELRVADFNTRYRDLLASGADVLTARPVGAPGPVGIAQLQEYFTNELGLDSLATQERSGFGDVAVAIRILLLHRPPAPQRRVAARLTASAAYRFNSGSQQSPSPLTDLRLGRLGDVVEVQTTLDLAAGRFGLLAAGDVQVAGAVAVPVDPVLVAGAGPEYSSTWIGLHVSPRVQLSAPLALHGAYSMRRSDSRDQRFAGGGASFSTRGDFDRGGPLPLEMRYMHLEALRGSVGEPKFVRDQIELRIYFGRSR